MHTHHYTRIHTLDECRKTPLTIQPIHSKHKNGYIVRLKFNKNISTFNIIESSGSLTVVFQLACVIFVKAPDAYYMFTSKGVHTQF